MDKKEFDAIIKQPPNIRYDFFIKKVVDYEEVWGLYNDGWATAKDEEDNLLIPFFPKKVFAENCAEKEWAAYEAKLLGLDEFIEKWLTGMKKDGIKPSIFPTEVNTAVVSIDVIIKDLETELENY
ncbi:DUF2750 domain-containing protein [Metabacillus idriensis]|uniref:DUF2750 domain-containing protein n=1 Tax=Metabacillus idriensis TaxID=324768 RepID=UPI00174CAE7C|nr:DUF2750 domain-containing protein [Metabacillus idriensis]